MSASARRLPCVLHHDRTEVVPMSALVAAAFRRRRVAGELLSDVVLRGTAARGGGFVSGHAATSTALVAVAVRAP